MSKKILKWCFQWSKLSKNMKIPEKKCKTRLLIYRVSANLKSKENFKYIFSIKKYVYNNLRLKICSISLLKMIELISCKNKSNWF